MKIEKIYVYPVKALRAVELEEVQVTKHGFPHDRRFMMLHVQQDANNNNTTTYKNIAVAHYPQSVFFFPTINSAAGILTVTYKPPNSPSKSVDFPLAPHTDGLEVVEVTMHGSPTPAYKMPQEYNDWFSACYGFDVILVYLGPHYRPVLMSTSPNVLRPFSKNDDNNNNNSSKSKNNNGWLSSLTSSLTPSSFLTADSSSKSTRDEQLLTFNDCAPYLIASTKSMEDVTSRLPASEASHLDIIKFRPNIIISGASEAWEEDFWSQLAIHSSSSSSAAMSADAPSTTTTTLIECIHNCGRCKSINIDYTTGAPGTTESGQLLKKLQRDRRVDAGVKYSPIFGRYAFLHESSDGHVIRRGDEAEVSRRNVERTTFGKFLFISFFFSIGAFLLVFSRIYNMSWVGYLS